MKSKYIFLLVGAGLALNIAFAQAAKLGWSFTAPSVSDHSAVDVEPNNGGEIAFDSTAGNFYAWDGTNWNNLTGAASVNLNVRSVSSTDTASDTDDVLILSGSSFTETLFTAVGNTGKVLQIVHGGTSLSQVYTLNTTSGQTIGGVASGSYALHTNGEKLKVVSDGANWIILDHYTKTAEVSYNPALTGFGTPSAVAFTWYRDGEHIYVSGRFTSGTSTSTEARVSLPTNVPNVSSVITTLQIAGVASFSGVAAAYYTILAEPAVAYLTFGRGSGSLASGAKTTGDNLATSGQTISISARIPITGWQP